jgi:diguanylate cyclase (GGDEF)-like protein
LLGIYFGNSSLLALFLALACLAGVVAYIFFSASPNRLITHSLSIPDRVQSAFDALSEGLLILDEKHRVVVANESFAEKVGIEVDALINQPICELDWKKRDYGSSVDQYPWVVTTQNCQRNTGIPMRLQLLNESERTFSVNTAPIFDANGELKGVLATFDDMTDLEKKHRLLQSTLDKLRSSEKALRDKTLELELLASRDALTGCLNRRSFFQKMEHHFIESLREGHGLVFMLVDIDNFKYINDKYGHANGDKVIKFVADVLVSKSRPEDIVGRYGGEEFVILMPHTDLLHALKVAERLRMEIQQEGYALFDDKRTVTASFGLAEMIETVDESMELIGNADDALYKAKQLGRNRVICWQPDMSDGMRFSMDSEMSDVERASHESYMLEKSLKNEIRRLEDTVHSLEEQIEYCREEVKRNQGTDKLTGLPNSIIFRDRISQVLSQCRRYDRSAALISLDIDDFHTINEGLGYGIGDQLLKVVSKRLVETLRETDTVAVIGEECVLEASAITRINNDEFALILTDVNGVDGATWAIRRLQKALKEDIELEGQELFPAYNIGVALYPLDDDQPDGLLKKATSARYAAKRSESGDNIRFFSQDINRDAYRKVWLENQLHKAILRNEITLAYQPIVELKSGRITKLEALARWNHPKVGDIPPSEFIPIAEHTGLIHKLGLRVLHTACRDLKAWHSAGFDDLQVSVNLSAVQFRRDDLVEKILRICEKVGLSNDFVDFEITESALMENFDVVLRVMKQMSRAGISFTLDDFGKGFSSLSYLAHLPINCIKIDQSFIRETLPGGQDQTILNSMIALAKSLDLKVVVEGLETEAQRKKLTGLGCESGQGILISGPGSREDATKLLRDNWARR